jgi:hypothetical protein
VAAQEGTIEAMMAALSCPHLKLDKAYTVRLLNAAAAAATAPDVQVCLVLFVGAT